MTPEQIESETAEYQAWAKIIQYDTHSAYMAWMERAESSAQREKALNDEVAALQNSIMCMRAPPNNKEIIRYAKMLMQSFWDFKENGIPLIKIMITSDIKTFEIARQMFSDKIRAMQSAAECLGHVTEKEERK